MFRVCGRGFVCLLVLLRNSHHRLLRGAQFRFELSIHSLVGDRRLPLVGILAASSHHCSEYGVKDRAQRMYSSHQHISLILMGWIFHVIRRLSISRKGINIFF